MNERKGEKAKRGKVYFSILKLTGEVGIRVRKINQIYFSTLERLASQD